jgi:hypothetical protein
MNCLESLEMLQTRLDGGTLEGRAALEAHLAACSECRERHAAAALLAEGLRGLPRVLAPEDLAGRTTACLLRDRRLRLRRRVGLLLAASLVLATLTGGLWLDQARSRQKAILVTAARVPGEPAPEGPALREALGGARAALAGLLDRIGEKTREQFQALEVSTVPLQFVSLDSLPRVNLLAQPLDSTAQSLRRTGDGVAAGTRTVRASAGRALRYFLGKLPPAQPERGPQ